MKNATRLRASKLSVRSMCHVRCRPCRRPSRNLPSRRRRGRAAGPSWAPRFVLLRWHHMLGSTPSVSLVHRCSPPNAVLCTQSTPTPWRRVTQLALHGMGGCLCGIRRWRWMRWWRRPHGSHRRRWAALLLSRFFSLKCAFMCHGLRAHDGCGLNMRTRSSSARVGGFAHPAASGGWAHPVTAAAPSRLAHARARRVPALQDLLSLPLQAPARPAPRIGISAGGPRWVL